MDRKRPKQKVKAKHALNWFYGNICVKKCYDDLDKQRRCNQKMKEMIKGHEDYFISHKDFIRVVREKHRICDISEELFRRSEWDFWWRKL